MNWPQSQSVLESWLKLPDEVVEDDYRVITLLKRYMEEGTETASDVSIVSDQERSEPDDIPASFTKEGRTFFRITRPRHDPLPKAIGTQLTLAL